jgi:two-component system cell cycle response regulator
MKILIAEDDKASRRILEKNIAEWGYDIVVASNGEEALRSLREGDVRLAILDWMMPGINGIELCRFVREDGGPKYVYIIMLTSRDQRQDIVEGLEAGADDYMAKPVNFLELRARIQTGRRIVELEDKLLESNRRLKDLASRDSLTSLWNRANAFVFLEEEVARGQRESRPVSVIMIDVDNFKGINDAHGHLAGDIVLIEIAKRLERGVRAYDRVGRYGGDEMLIILPGCDMEEAAAVGERLRRSISGKKVRTPDGSFPVTVTLGCSCSELVPDATAESLVRESDTALYRGKTLGRNRVVAGSR